MRAVRLKDWKSEPVVEEVADPVPGLGEVVVRIGGAGLCHSDLHLMHEFEPGLLPWNPPFTLGHENAGWVHAVGEGVTDVEVGQAVAVVGAWGCGSCTRCRTGYETYCENPAAAPVPGGGGGLGLDGGIADFLKVPSSRVLVPLPAGLDPVVAAPLTDAGLTPYHAIRRSLPKLTADATAVVIGAGGLGHMAVQILKAVCAAQVVVVDTRQEALDLAKRHGADLVVQPGDGAVEQIREFSHGRGADVVLDHVGADATLQLGAAVGRQMGDLSIIGIAGGTLPVSFFSLPYEMSVQTTYWGNRFELVELLDLAARGLVRPDITTVGLDEVPETYRRLAAGEISGRAVAVPS